jgi:ATP adenylyltransferase
MEYIKGADSAEGCFLCDLPARGEDEDHFILRRGTHAFVIMNLYPYNSGHLLVAPFRHVGNLEDLRPEEAQEGFALLGESVAALKQALDPHGFNIGMNLGRVAGAGVPDHLHFHIVPRWGGDTNFMPVLGETKVLPELLAQTFAKLKPHFGEPADA